MHSAKQKMDKSLGRDGELQADWLDDTNMGEIRGISMSASSNSTCRKRELNGAVKIGGSGNDFQHSQLHMQIGSGMAAAVEQLRRPQ